ncbi:hypothetical protein EDB84DRAFT_1572666 [Lactarius hengduanensis]|nr:hypothetical protein EDB84DRAFT_1572666 [Lactarius hengduanensis]
MERETQEMANEEEEDKPLGTWDDFREGLTEQQVTELDASVHPVRSMLVKLCKLAFALKNLTTKLLPACSDDLSDKIKGAAVWGEHKGVEGYFIFDTSTKTYRQIHYLEDRRLWAFIDYSLNEGQWYMISTVPLTLNIGRIKTRNPSGIDIDPPSDSSPSVPVPTSNLPPTVFPSYAMAQPVQSSANTTLMSGGAGGSSAPSSGGGGAPVPPSGGGGVPSSGGGGAPPGGGGSGGGGGGGAIPPAGVAGPPRTRREPTPSI